MKIYEFLIPQLQQEVALTEKFLKRIPEDKMDYKPHEKSMTIRQIANHLAEIPSWITGTMEAGNMDVKGYKPLEHGTVDEIVKELKNNTAEAEKALKKADDEFERMWRMTNDGEILFEMPKFNVLQSMVMGQFPHHRAQLGVYFRLLDISVPATYGPSADEQ
ncbi:DinB family protein [Gramella sp. GC03-9]|uniref:DinB family protein n=1 Tax=Christiangramia oceanisediminis TaxID=2920386 RepID=A0A9X2KZT9_9FLAO|nr:DinB family protein [Gramella oceanisediminis]MCP9201244.1 DinB family protein [Gramella oceanisediminis]